MRQTWACTASVRWLTALVASVSGLAAAAESLGPPASQAAHTATVLGIEVRIRGPLSFPTYNADTVYFVRRCEGEPGCDGALIPSTFAKKGRAYLVDAKAGEYVAVAAMFQVMKAPDRYIVYFPVEVIDSTATKVTADDAQLFAGSFVLDTSIGLCPEKAEPKQLAYAEQLAPGSVKCGLAGTVLDMAAYGDYVFVGGVAVPARGLLYHYRGLSRESHREPADLERLKGLASADLAGYQSSR